MQSEEDASAYGLKALATVVFDVDSGPKLNEIYPPTCELSEAAKKSLAYLSLPHCSNLNEGDTQYTVRFKDRTDDSELLFGFVLFRQLKDESQVRGYSQKALIIVSTKPFLDLYDRALRLIGPIFFKIGAQVLAAVYNDIKLWPDVVYNAPIVLPLAGTYISCIIPELLNYEYIDTTYEAVQKSPNQSHFIVGGDYNATESSEIFNPDVADNDTGTVLSVEGDNFVFSRQQHPPTPSFGDLLLSKPTHRLTPFESIGLYSSFNGFEESLWLLWQLAISGESLLLLSSCARTCSQAALAFASMIAPLQFQGDCRPYYTLYEADFDTLARSQNNGSSSPDHMAVIGSTNPFLLKSLSLWPNALIFPFHPHETGTAGANNGKAAKVDAICLRIKENVELDNFDTNYRPAFLRRCPRYMIPDVSVLQQLIPIPKLCTAQSLNCEEEPHITINNAILRKHFRKLTIAFLEPFEQYFGVWKANGGTTKLYINVEDSMKPFTLLDLLSTIKPQKLSLQIKQTKWKALYTAFVKGPHFEPWFNNRRKRCIHDFTETLRFLRNGVEAQYLLCSPFGTNLSREQYLSLKKEMKLALAQENARGEVDKQQVKTIKRHLQVVKNKICSVRKEN